MTTIDDTGNLKDANFPVDEEGRVYHLALKYGTIANRILCVGDPQRARLLNSLLDDPSGSFYHSSNRGFITYTGTKNGVPVSIISIGMGLPMMDFMVREARHIVKGPMCILRLGTCGTSRDDVPLGSVVVSHSSACITANFDAHLESKDLLVSPFHFSKPIPGDPKVFQSLSSCLKSKGDITVVEGMDVTCDTFYSSQGRRDDNFDDKNSKLFDDISHKYPNASSIQMETFQLFHLARLSKGLIQAGACAIVLAQRRKNEFLNHQTKHKIELISGSACLEMLAHKWEVDENLLMNDDACVWKNTRHFRHSHKL